MVDTRNQATATAERAAATARSVNSYAKFKRSYKDLTPSQQRVTRHNRFLDRVWKMPRSERGEHRKCVACLGDFFDSDGSGTDYIGIMACDHAIHLKCLIRHADSHLDMKGVPSLDDWPNLSESDFDFAARERFIYRRLGAPCPACRMEFPMQHMTVFDTGPIPKGLGIHVQSTPRDW